MVSFGSRSVQITSIIRHLKKVTTMPVVLYTDKVHKDLDTHQRIIPQDALLWRDSPRWGIRNCNLWSAKACLEEFDSVCVLNDDMRIVHGAWVDGFQLAERFGCAVPLNPRIYVKYNAMGADTSPQDLKNLGSDSPLYGPACNVSPLFFSRKWSRAVEFMEGYIECLKVCNRGTLAFWMASWRTGFTPVYLPEQWCVCEGNAKYIRDYKKHLQGKDISIEPIMLHWGQKGVREAFPDVE